MHVKDNQIVWDDYDFGIHPDEAAISVIGEIKDIASDWPCKTLIRYGGGHVLPDGRWIFPGEAFVSILVTV